MTTGAPFDFGFFFCFSEEGAFDSHPSSTSETFLDDDEEEETQQLKNDEKKDIVAVSICLYEAKIGFRLNPK
ncbi:hypothetical protein LR48_Vigan05g046600 [Vigna angularis]|uniref:Uncharacterized protein n=1 Tax=Phaseolus angularis TaxID=3914 RepID=A0A0L9UJW1_PHAAN|nr:hypothetical protein LR48_Vigan05g046600 [Vigna angularis]